MHIKAVVSGYFYWDYVSAFESIDMSIVYTSSGYALLDRREKVVGTWKRPQKFYVLYFPF